MVEHSSRTSLLDDGGDIAADSNPRCTQLIASGVILLEHGTSTFVQLNRVIDDFRNCRPLRCGDIEGGAFWDMHVGTPTHDERCVLD